MHDVPNARFETERKRWILQVQVDGQRKAFTTTKAKSQREANKILKAKAYEWIDNRDITRVKFKRAWELFLENYRHKNTETSARQIESRGKAHLVERFKGRIVSEISKVEWQQVIDDAFENGAKSSQTLRGIESTIKVFCSFCAAKGFIRDVNVPLHFILPTDKLTRTKKPLQPAEIQTLFDPAEDDADWYIPMFRFLVMTGLRRGELCALQTERDFIDGVRIVTRESISHEEIVTDGKTANSERGVFLPKRALAALELHRKNRAKRGIPLKTKHLFVNERGERIKPRRLSDAWRTWRDEHGIDITLHELRHTFASYAAHKGLSLELVKLILGHAKSMNTEGVYVHNIEETAEEILDRMQKEQKASEEIDDVFDNVMALLDED